MKKIAIVGAGISGLSTAFHLYRDYRITIFEKENYFGGHTDTHELIIDDQKVRIDSGFIIFCPEYYPHFSAMLNQLNVECQPTDMSFAAHNRQTGVIYNATTSLNKLFCQRRNIFKPRFLRMLLDIVRFYRNSPKVLDDNDVSVSVDEYLKANRYGQGFIDDHLLPMISALWSATPQKVLEFPIHHLVDFFQRHGLLKLIGRPQWQVIKNGSRSYVEALRQQLDCDWQSGVAVDKVIRNQQGVSVALADGSNHSFDAVVFACHADQALAMLDTPNEHERRILGSIPFEPNHVVVHTDESIMHPNKLSWASWNTVVPDESDDNSLLCCTANYWMNSLQGLDLNSNVFTSLNLRDRVAPNKILAERHYSHPVFNRESVAAQKDKHLIDGQQHSYYVGAYWGWGFHEDGARSAFEVSRQIRETL